VFKRDKLGITIISLAMAIIAVGYQFFISYQEQQNQPVLGVSDDRGFEQALVTRIVDGDTVELSDGRKVRLIGMDTPETKHPSKGKECFGSEASLRTAQLLENKAVWLEQDVSETDRYGRLLRYIWRDGQMINHQLVVEGYAFTRSFPPDIAHQDLFAEAEKIARENNQGLWSQCPLNDTNAINKTIQDIDTSIAKSASDGVENSGDCKIKGNISSNGQLYHLPGCSSYNATVISESKGERWFCSEAEAQAAGWIKSGSC
jgi:micrococcal nuclease